MNLKQRLLKRRFFSHFMFFILGLMLHHQISLVKALIIKRRNVEHKNVKQEATREISDIINMIDSDTDDDIVY